MTEKIKNNDPINLNPDKTGVSKQSIFLSILFSIKAGINCALILFTLLVFTKLLLFFTLPGKEFYITPNDLIISFWGFLIVSFIISARLLRYSG